MNYELSFTENFITESLYNIINKNQLLSFKSYLNCIESLYDDCRMKGYDSPMMCIAQDLRKSRIGNTNIDDDNKIDDKLVDLLLLLLYFPFKHWLGINRIRYKQIRNKEYHIYLFNGKYWEENKDPIDYARKILRAVGYNYDMSLDESVTASIYKAIKKIEFKMQPAVNNILNFQNLTLRFDADGVNCCGHNLEHYCNYIIPHNYIATTNCANFERFINNILKPEDQKIFLNFIASAFSPTRLHQKMLNIYGKAGSGKSTLVDIISLVLNKSVIAAGFSNLVTKSAGFSQSDALEMLRGKTLFHAREVNNFGNKFFDAELFKMLIEGSEIHLNTSVTMEYREPIRCPIIIATSNDAMDLSKVDKGVARRITYIDVIAYEPEKNIPNLAELIYQKEAVGIINLIVKSYNEIIEDKYNKNLFDNELSANAREENRLYDNPVQEAINWAYDNRLIQIMTDKPKTQWSTLDFIRELTLLAYPDSKFKINHNKQIGRLLTNSSVHKDINTHAVCHQKRVVNIEYTREGLEKIEMLKIQRMQEKLKDMELRNAIK